MATLKITKDNIDCILDKLIIKYQYDIVQNNNIYTLKSKGYFINHKNPFIDKYIIHEIGLIYLYIHNLLDIYKSNLYKILKTTNKITYNESIYITENNLIKIDLDNSLNTYILDYIYKTNKAMIDKENISIMAMDLVFIEYIMFSKENNYIKKTEKMKNKKIRYDYYLKPLIFNYNIDKRLDLYKVSYLHKLKDIINDKDIICYIKDDLHFLLNNKENYNLVI